MITRGDITNKLKELKKITKPNGKKHTKNEVKELIQLWLQDKKDEGEVFGQVKEYKYITKDDKGKDIVQIKNIEKNVIQRIISDLESYSEFNSITDIK